MPGDRLVMGNGMAGDCSVPTAMHANNVVVYPLYQFPWQMSGEQQQRKRKREQFIDNRKMTQ